MTLKTGNLFLTLSFLALAGCAVGPDYRRPQVETPAAYKEAQGWKKAEPQDQAPRGAWWEMYGDPQLNALEQQVALSNQNIRIAEAQYRQALALLGAARAGYFPTLSAGLAANRGQAAAASATNLSAAPVGNTDRLSLSASWEADVWGRIGRGVESNQASAEASAADLQAALLSAQATLAQSYLQLRVNDTEQQLLERTVAAYEKALQITVNRYQAGVAGRLDVAQAETQLKSAQAQAIDLGVQRTQLEHAIALLVGKAPAEFNLEANGRLASVPDIPLGVPSELLERRPDIAAAERRAAAANARIGVAQAAFFPALTLAGSAGYQASGFASLIALPNRFWSLGPALAATLFDGGARSAQKEQAIAAFDSSVATYRQTVLAGFQEVEDNLSALRILAEEARVQQAAAKSAAESVTLANNQYLAGTVSYLNVVSAQAASLGADKSALDIAGRRLVASVTLLKALGGDWRSGNAK
ncbi:MAG: efflux transporter outer membrane subunit [Sulfuricella sp.]|nr:efflux transporter outer membrane subunit [Sulfuricella sp.]